MATPRKQPTPPRPDAGDAPGRAVHPEKAPEQFRPESARQNNAEASPSNTDRLVQDGRGQQTKGRGTGNR